MKMRNFALIHSLLFVLVILFGTNLWPFLLLTVAQLVYVPIALRLVMVQGRLVVEVLLLFRATCLCFSWTSSNNSPLTGMASWLVYI